MKIAHFMRGIWDKGGIASYIRRVSEEQLKLGHSVVFLDPIPSEVLGSNDKFKTIYLADERLIYETAESINVDVLHVHTLLPRVKSITVPTIRTLHGHQPYCPSGGRFLKLSKKPCEASYSLLGCTLNHFTQHCGSIRPRKLASEFQQTWHEMGTLKSIPTLPVSNFLKEQMIRSGYPAEKIAVHYLPTPPVDHVVPVPKDDIPHFVFLGRLSRTKGLEWLLHSVKAANGVFHLDVGGDGEDKERILALATRLGLNDKVTFHGWVREVDAFKLLSNARALVFPSLWHEPGGTVAYESLINGRPVIVSRVGGIPEIVQDGVHGLIVEPGNVEALANAITDLAQDWEKANRMGLAGRSHILGSYMLDEHTKVLVQHYDSCIRNFGKVLPQVVGSTA